MASSFSDIDSDPSDYSDVECTATTDDEQGSPAESSAHWACTLTTMATSKNQQTNIKTAVDSKQLLGIDSLLTATKVTQNEGKLMKHSTNETDNTMDAESDCDYMRNSTVDQMKAHQDGQTDFDTASTVSSTPKSNSLSLSKKPKRKKEWRKYYTRKTPILVLKCLICSDAFTAHTQWRKHMNTVHDIARPYKCKLCEPKNVCYANQAGLNAHIQRDHEKVRNWKCEHCPKAFYRKSVWMQHQRVHDGLRPFQCPECELAFTQRNAMKQHIKSVHRKDRNYVCSYCKKGFAALTTLKSHMVSIHNDAHYARFECDICHKRFYDGNTYRSHRDGAHRPVDPIKAVMKRGECFYEGCGKKYTSKNCIESVKYHLVHTHGDRRFAKYECKKCDKLFYDKTAYSKHMKEQH